MFLQSGYPVQPRNGPKRPRFKAIGFPQMSQDSSVASAACSPESPEALEMSLLFLQSGYPVQERNAPKRPSLTIIGLPQTSHGSFVDSLAASCVASLIACLALLSSSLNGP